MSHNAEISFDLLSSTAANLGLDILAVLPVEFVVTELENKPTSRLRLWQDSGYAGNMSYMMRSGELLANPRKLLASVRTVISFLVPYFQNSTEWIQENHAGDLYQDYLTFGKVPDGHGRVARYAWGGDYHKAINRLLRTLVQNLSETCGKQIESRVFVDAVPLLERSVVAAANSQTFIGQNSMLIKRGIGSFFFLAEILCDVDFPFTFPQASLLKSHNSEPGGNCGTCKRCVSKCPSGALLGEGLLDSQKCISYLTIEKRDLFSDWEQESIGSWVFGCDECQDVCSFNARCLNSGKSHFMHKNGVGPFLSADTVLDIGSDKEFISKFAGTSLIRPGRLGLIRNTLALLANTRYFKSVPAIERFLGREESASIRFYAIKILRKLLVDADGTDLRRIQTILRRTEGCVEEYHSC